MDALTEHLSSYVAGLTYDDIPAEAIHGMKVRLVDTIGCAIGGRDGEPAGVARALAREAVGTTPARVWFTGERTTPELAAFANELMVRYLDFNDTYFAMEGGHPSDTIAATLTLSDAIGLSGRDALVAMVAAYEVFCGLGEVHKPSARFIDHSLHVALGSAAGASKALGLDAERTAHAISIALTANLGLRIARDGRLSMWKAGSAANSAQAGVFAARLAEKGMTGPDEAFYADSGLAGILGARTPLPALGGGTHLFHTNLSSIKAFPAQFNAQAAVWAALGLRERLGGALPDRIAVRSYRQAVTSSADPEKWHVHDRETADHSIPYLVAVALLDGEVTVQQFTDQRIADSAVHELIARVEVTEDTEMTALFPRAQAARIDAIAGGETYVVEVENAKGNAANPLSDEEVDAKFRSLAGGVMGQEQAESLLSRLWTFEEEPSVPGVVDAMALHGGS